MIVTAILHDTLEDTELTKEKIAEEFGIKVANQVMDLTRIRENGIKISAAETVERLYKEKKHDVLLIKLFDRLHNMETIGAKSLEKAKKIVEETLISFLAVAAVIDIRLEKCLIQLCFACLKIDISNIATNLSDDNFQIPYLTL